MLVCNVSLRPARRAITADIAEVIVAIDATATGTVVFATLVDDPASVNDTVDAYLGEIMLEAAGASDSLSAGSIFIASVDEAVTAMDTQTGAVPTIIPARDAMLPGVFVNSDGTLREANANGVMVNL